MSRQAVLFTPGDERRMVNKALVSDADMVNLDIEDAVAPSAKEDAARIISEVLRDTDPEDIEVEVSVRINSFTTRGEEDLAILADASERIENIVLPKVQGVETIGELTDILAEHGFDSNIMPIIETPQSMVDLPEIADHPRVVALEFGAEDFTTEISGLHTDSRDEIIYGRQKIVTVAAAADIDAIDMAWPDFTDTEGLRRNAEQAVEFGYDGKSAIHPVQLEVIKDVFSPDEERVEWARKIVNRAEKEKKKRKIVFQIDGEMIDPPIINRAHDILERDSET